jgi:hypothetical protein
MNLWPKPTHRMRLLPILFAMYAVSVAGCAHNLSRPATSGGPTVATLNSGICVLGTPNHQADWERLRAALEIQHIHSPGYEGDLGVFQFCIPRKDAAHARQVIENAIRDNLLTVRVTKDADAQVYDVYEGGKKIREESYPIK